MSDPTDSSGNTPPRRHSITGITGQPDSVIDGIVHLDGFPNPTDVHDASGGPGIQRPSFNTGDPTSRRCSTSTS